MIIPISSKLKYLNHRVEELEQIKKFCLLNSNEMDTMELFSSIKMIGHKLKGNGSTFGYPALSYLGGEIEEAAKSFDIKKLKELSIHYDELIRNYFTLLNI